MDGEDVLGPSSSQAVAGPAAPASTVDVAVLVAHVRRLVAALTDVDERAIDTLLAPGTEGHDRARTFAADPQRAVLVFVSTVEAGGASEDRPPTLSVQLDMVLPDNRVAAVAFIKRGAGLDPSRPLSGQLHLLNIGDGSPSELLHAYIHNAVSPFFNAYASKISARSGASDREAKTGIPAVRKKMAELEVSLLNLQENMDIPTVTFQLHPDVQAIVAECMAKNRRPTLQDVPESLLSDTAFHNKLQSGLNLWVKEMERIVVLVDREPAASSSVRLVNFWAEVERALAAIDALLRTDGVLLTRDILKHAKRIGVVMALEAQPGLREAKETALKCNATLSELPINELLSAMDIERVRESLERVVQTLKKKTYPAARLPLLVESISRDVRDQLLRVLSSVQLLALPFAQFAAALTATDDVLDLWSAMVETLVKTDKRQKSPSARLHLVLKQRLDSLKAFRQQHDQLRATIAKVLRPSGETASAASSDPAGAGPAVLAADAAAGIDAVEEVDQAYAPILRMDVLDLSPEGAQAWEAAELAYGDRVARVENAIITLLRDALAGARNASEMFRVLGRFNTLFVRPKVRGAVQEYQVSLIKKVEDDLMTLYRKFEAGYEDSEAANMSVVRDIPAISGKLIWAAQIERQLATYMSRVEAILGKGWENYQAAQKLNENARNFRAKLSRDQLVKNWLDEIQRRDLKVEGSIFSVRPNRLQGHRLQLVVNFDDQLISLFKEVRNLAWMDVQVPASITSVANVSKAVYPYAVSLFETVRTYQATNARVEANATVALLVAGHHKRIQGLIAAAKRIGWGTLSALAISGRAATNSSGEIAQIRELAASVSAYHDKANELLSATDEIVRSIDALRFAAFKPKALREIMENVQHHVDQLSRDALTNLDAWVIKLNERVENILAARLRVAIRAWTTAFSADFAVGGAKSGVNAAVNGGGDTSMDSSKQDDTLDISTGANAIPLPELPVQVHEIRIRNQVLSLSPPLEEGRATWIRSLFEWLGVACELPRLQSARYTLTQRKGDADTEEVNFRGLLLQLLRTGQLQEAYKAIDDKLSAVASYAAVWLQYQALWDLEPAQVYTRLGDDLSRWQRLLADIRGARATFDNNDTRRSFGTIVVDYGQVQAKVNAKYDFWQREIVTRFGQRLGAAIADLFAGLSRARSDLEEQSLESDNTADAVAFITFIGDVKRRLPGWTNALETCRAGQKLLERQRFQFPADWLYFDMVLGEWSAFNEILARKDAALQGQIATVQLKIVQEDTAIDARIRELAAEWDQRKPVQGDVKPDQATASLAAFESRFTRLQEEHLQVARAKEALNLDISGEDRLQPLLEELRDLKGVWIELTRVWLGIQELSDTMWSAVVARKVRTRLDALLAELKDLPARLRQYAAYDFVQSTLRGYLKVNTLVSELKSDALRERHWRMLFKKLRAEGRFLLHEMTLGHVWDLQLVRNEPAVKEVILVAQGEMALEEFLKQVRETWQTYELELVPYQNKCRLIRGWDELFGKCAEHVSSLSAMKLSPYYKVFEDEAAAWEEKLNRVSLLFDVWIDVQRQWVYLEGIFSGSADIKNLLPTETARFQSINAEFLGVMKKVAKAPAVMEVVAIPGVQRSLERLADLLGKIQKALGDYLERERAAFARFYFVGDEDLLDIIGNSKDVLKIQKHFKKMFAGLAALLLRMEDNADGVAVPTAITGIASREGEEVHFLQPVSLKDGLKINEWLGALEKQMRLTLAALLGDAVRDKADFFPANAGAAGAAIDGKAYLAWVAAYPAQLVVLASQVLWSEATERALNLGDAAAILAGLQGVLARLQGTLTVLADTVLQDLVPIQRRKCEHLITELVHQRDVARALIRANVTSPRSFEWLYQMRFYYNAKGDDPLTRLAIRMANASFDYGYEYLGLTDKLVQTPLTDRCYLTLTQALELRLGGSPFGPAGTGKTESVKALGAQLGRFVLVFCCDETFDFQAMGRIFVGLCQFDEFNRLEERILSAVSQQVQTIQQALKDQQGKSQIVIEVVGKSVTVQPQTGIFITMNPGYAGRSNLPDNLKKLFRSMAMTKPDRELIAQVMLYSQGFRTAELLASKVVPFFNLCEEQLSVQPHYDFGLRALKSVLVSAGNLKRDRMARLAASGAGALPDQAEQEILIQSVAETVVPKLVADDIPLLKSLLADVFPGVPYMPADLERLRAEVGRVCAARHLVPDAGWVEKVLQLYQIQHIHHGLMMVGPSGSGKTTAWSVLLAALAAIEGTEGVAHVIDPKAIPKDDLYGTLDSTTREWSDGLFTHVLRKIIDNVRGELGRRQWIIFDGDVDPEWVENLNSVLDDNKLLTLPNGERLALPPNVRIMFEVQDLRYATLATVSRCGMVWFSEAVVSLQMSFTNYLERLRHVVLDDAGTSGNSSAPGAAGAADEPGASAPGAPGAPGVSGNSSGDGAAAASPALRTQRECVGILEQYFAPDALVEKAVGFAEGLEHIMEFTRARALGTLFSMLNKSIRNVLEYNEAHSDFPMALDHQERYLTKRLLYALVWSLAGDARLVLRADLGRFLLSVLGVHLPHADRNLIDYEVLVASGEWALWSARVPNIDIETHKVSSADVVVPTIDTTRHEDVLYSWLAERKPVLLAGPPGSGKSMTLFAALRALPELEVVGLNFSSATTPELILKTFEQYCEYRKTPSGMVLAPTVLNKWLVLFCDEINLPAQDKYGTQRVISFMRQMIEQGGFWRAHDKVWVRLSRIQFVGACNPPTDPGRVPLSARFLRHAPVVMVDYPGPDSLRQIYGTFTRALLKPHPALRGFAAALTDAMAEVYLESQAHFTPDQQAHYIYSPRELTRWVRGIFEALNPLDAVDLNYLVRVWAHEGLRLFADRLVTADERAWTGRLLDETAAKHFPSMDAAAALRRPILFSDWLSKNYVPVEQEALREYIRARLRVFYEEELDVPLVLFSDLLEHVLRIDRVFKQVQGHLLLIGVSGAGKTTLSRFVAWLNGLHVYQIKVRNAYTMEDFDDDLRGILRRAGTKGEKIAFVLDESNILDAGFLERMNTLLANGEVPGLFDGEEHAALMSQCKEGAAREGLMLDSADELYRWFTAQVMRNLHVVFTMNPPEDGLGGRAATSPALFNRCVLDWFGDWSLQAYFQVGKEFTDKLDLDVASYRPPDFFPTAYPDLPTPVGYRDAVVNAFVFIHHSLVDVNQRVAKRQGRINHVTPRHYLDFIQHYVKLYQQKRAQLEDQQLHLNVGLQKLRDTFESVETLQKSLAIKTAELERKNLEANDKLRRMVQEQQEAESKKRVSEDISRELAVQNQAIMERKKVVEVDLAKAEPAVREAEQSVRNIKTQHLVEVRGLANPPALVKLALESVCVLLGEKADSWKTIQGILRRNDFIASIVNYDTETRMTDAMRKEMRATFLSNPDYTFEKIDRASKACGPLALWAIAQVQFSEILTRVEPLRNEVKQLEEEAEAARIKAAELNTMIAELEASIARYKDEYAVLIAQTQALKAEMETVRTKVERATKLLGSLSSERDRWVGSSATFDAQMGTIVGDVLVSAAFLAYAGFFDQHHRGLLLSRWTGHLQEAGLQFKTDLALIEYLSTADERLGWSANALPSDDLCLENAIMLGRFNRFPLIIDPSGQATAFLMNQYRDKITRTSFLDKAFLKTLESALRFGSPLIIEDVESLDPVLNPLLNREVRRTGGRVLVRLGTQDIDLSPTFNLFLTSRDPTANFAPDLCSRVTFVNFTVTPASLQSQCLHQVLKSERPDTDRQRTDLLRMQGEFQVRLRQLEKSLLDALNASKGSLLDNDTVVATLETLKREATDIAERMAATETVAAQVAEVTQQYTPLSAACSALFFCMESLQQLNHFYQFSLDFFYGIFQYVLHTNPALANVKDPKARLEILFRDLFAVSFARVARGLLNEDRVTFALLLAQIFVRGSSDRPDDREWDFWLSGAAVGDTDVAAAASANASGGKALVVPPELADLLDDEARGRAIALARLPAFAGLAEHIVAHATAWQGFLQSAAAEAVVPDCFADAANGSIVTSFRRALVVKTFRPDRVVPAASLLAERVFSKELLSLAPTDANLLRRVVKDEVQAQTPVALCSVPGLDASFTVDALARDTPNVSLTSVAIGSAEGYAEADKAISAAAKSGAWVMLKNVHLAPAWLAQLEKRLHGLKPHPSFRLFLTAEINPSVPASVLRLSRIFMYERAPGLRANLTESLSGIARERAERAPVERARLMFLVAWLHAVVQERLRYAPLGWTKVYEFNDADRRCALDVIDAWVDATVGPAARTNLDPNKIPWDALRTLLAQSVYGGRVDNDFDQLTLQSFVNGIFTPKAYDANFVLARVPPATANDTEHLVLAPEGTTMAHFQAWVDNLPVRQSPAWLGLPANAETVLLIAQGNALLNKLRSVAVADEEEAVVVTTVAAPTSGGRGGKKGGSRAGAATTTGAGVAVPVTTVQPPWMKALAAKVTEWLSALPKTLTLYRSQGGAATSSASAADPIARCFVRESSNALALLKKVRRDLDDLLQVCEGGLKQTNHLRALISDVNRGIIPRHWRKYKVPSSIALQLWVTDFAVRIRQLEALSSTSAPAAIWLGGLLAPEAYVTATRQAVAQSNHWSLEELSLRLEVAANEQPERDTFLLSGLRLEGAAWVDGRIRSSDAVVTRLPTLRLRWVRRTSTTAPDAGLLFPVYLNASRADVLFTVHLPVHDLTDHAVSQRALALVVSALK